MSFFPRFPTGEFAPLFRLLDDYASHQTSRGDLPPSTHLRTFQPRFDVKEGKDSYELHGELPGIEQKDIAIEFTDPQTLSIKGRTERTFETGTLPTTAAIQDSSTVGTITPAESDASYHKATVEDETAVSGALPSTEQAASNQEVATTTPEQQQQVQQQRKDPSRYWVSERSVGEFSRSFAFPSRVDHESVKASLKNGILSIVVPKASAPTLRRINIE